MAIGSTFFVLCLHLVWTTFQVPQLDALYSNIPMLQRIVSGLPNRINLLVTIHAPAVPLTGYISIRCTTIIIQSTILSRVANHTHGEHSIFIYFGLIFLGRQNTFTFTLPGKHKLILFVCRLAYLIVYKKNNHYQSNVHWIRGRTLCL